MKDTKFYPLLTLSILLLIASFIMMCVLGYNYFNRSQPAQPIAAKTTTIAKPAMNIAEIKTRDTLQKMYDSAITGFTPNAVMDAAFKTADTAQLKTADNKLSDFYKLKNDITTLLKDSSSSAADLELARFKIKELQVRVDDLKNRNIDIENENKRLHTLLDALVKNNSSAATDTKTSMIPENNTSAVFSASELKLAAADEDNTEVSNAEETEKFVGSVVVRNTLNQGTSEVMLVLIQPDGKVLRSSWESGSFDADGGKKIYSRKIKFDYSKGEFRRLDFSVPLDSCQKGAYMLQLYSKGKIIGKAVKVIG